MEPWDGGVGGGRGVGGGGGESEGGVLGGSEPSESLFPLEEEGGGLESDDEPELLPSSSELSSRTLCSSLA